MSSLDEARTALFSAAELRMPFFAERESPGNKIEKLEDFSVEAARHRGALEEQRLYTDAAVHDLSVKWSKLTGWESHLPRPRKNATKEDINEAKRVVDEDGLWDGIQEGRHLIGQLSAQIRRLEKDEDRASRIYTFITGN